MTKLWDSMLLGAAVALALSVPANAGDNDWVKKPIQTFPVHALDIDDMVGTLAIDVRDGGPATLEISGVQWKVKRLVVKRDGDRLRISGGGGGGHVWDWRRWFDFSNHGRDQGSNLYVHLVLPKGSAVDVDGLIGKARVADTFGPLKFETLGSADTRIGKVSMAELSLAGSGKIMVAAVAGDVKAETAGSGDIVIGDIGGVGKAEIAGSGSVSMGKVKKGLTVEIAGSGDFTAAAVQGPTRAEIAGSGSITIREGEANPFRVEIMGSGDVSFGGMAVDPDIEAMGSGNVSIKAYRGNLRTEGHVNLKIGK